jgi:hypothetical protein
MKGRVATGRPCERASDQTERPARLHFELSIDYDTWLPPGTTPWVRGARCTDPEGTYRTAGAQGDGSAAPGPQTATVERREASVPRRGTQGASQAPGMPRYGVPHGCSAEHPNVSRRCAHPLSGRAKQQCKPRARKTRRGNEMGCLKSEQGCERVRGLCVPDAMQRATKWSGKRGQARP